MSNFTDKVQIEKFLVADADAAVVADGATALFNDTTGVYNLSNEQLGIFNADTNTAISAGVDDASTAPRIFIAQGTEDSASPTTSSNGYPLPSRPVERSQVISADNKVTIVKKEPSYALDEDGVEINQTLGYEANSAWSIGDVTTGTADINIADNTEYALTISFSGRRSDYLNGRNEPAIFPTFTSPDYTNSSVYTTEALRRDHLVQNLVAKINQKSRVWPGNTGGSQCIALAIDSQASQTGSTTLGDIDDASLPGSAFVIGYTSDGSAVSYTPTSGFAQAVANALNSTVDGADTLAPASVVIPTLLATPPAGTAAETANTSTAYVAGVTANCDMILIISIENLPTAYYDRVYQTHTSLEVGLRSGFNLSTVANVEVSRAAEKSGDGRFFDLQYKSQDALRKYDNAQPPSGYTFEYPSDIDTTATYVSYIITHNSVDEATNGLPSLNPHKTIVLIEPGDTTTGQNFEDAIAVWAGGSGNVSLVGSWTGTFPGYRL